MEALEMKVYYIFLFSIFCVNVVRKKICDLSFGGMAQLGERCVRNAEVVGSNPIISMIFMCQA